MGYDGRYTVDSKPVGSGHCDVTESRKQIRQVLLHRQAPDQASAEDRVRRAVSEGQIGRVLRKVFVVRWLVACLISMDYFKPFELLDGRIQCRGHCRRVCAR